MRLITDCPNGIGGKHDVAPNGKGTYYVCRNCLRMIEQIPNYTKFKTLVPMAKVQVLVDAMKDAIVECDKYPLDNSLRTNGLLQAGLKQFNREVE